jgi:hypothetical protein
MIKKLATGNPAANSEINPEAACQQLEGRFKHPTPTAEIIS